MFKPTEKDSVLIGPSKSGWYIKETPTRVAFLDSNKREIFSYGKQDLKLGVNLKARLILEDGVPKVVLPTGQKIEVEVDLNVDKWTKQSNECPGYNEDFYYLDDGGRILKDVYLDQKYDNDRLEMGNYFKEESKAKNTIRALKLIEKIRRDRKKLNGNWKPSCENFTWEILIDGDYIYADEVDLLSFDVLGFYKSKEDAMTIIEKYQDELSWFFYNYLPQRS